MEPYRFTVALHDTDAAGVVFFAHLLRHAHDAYEALMAELGIPLPALLAEADYLLPLVHAEADFLAPLRHGDRVEVVVDVERLGDSAFTLRYTFRSAAGRAATAATVHVCTERATGNSRPLPTLLRSALSSIARPRNPGGR